MGFGIMRDETLKRRDLNSEGGGVYAVCMS
jgi:hypothetical protein